MAKRDPKQAERERQIFEAFLEAHPSFAKTLREKPIQPEAEFPDVITVDLAGRKVEWELGEWLDPAQTAAAKKAEASRDAIEAAISDPGTNQAQYVLWCMISLKEPAIPLQGEEAARVRDEMLALVRQVDAQWPENPPWHDPRGYRCTAFDAYPTLGKYLDAVQFEPRLVGEQKRRRPDDIPWIVVESRGGAYDPEIAVGALIQRLKAKAAHYADPGAADVRLVVFYDEAILYNTPFRGLTYRSFADVASRAATELQTMKVPFTRVYLLDAPNRVVFEVYPGFARCT